MEKDIDITKIIASVLKRKKTIYKTIIISFLVGLVIAIASPVEFESSITLLPENESSSGLKIGNIGSLMGLGNLSMGDLNESVIPSELFPRIVSSNPFQIDLLKDTIYFERYGKSMQLFYYFEEVYKKPIIRILADYTVLLPLTLYDAWKNDANDAGIDISTEEIIKISKKQEKIIENLKDRLAVEVNKKTGVIKINCLMQDPQAAAHLVKITEQKLTDFVTNYKISKAVTNLDFVKERHRESKEEYERAQEALSRFLDNNQNVISARAKMEEQRLQNRYNLTFEIFKSLSQQLEQAEMQVKEQTPVFTVLDPPKVPIKKSKPKRLTIVVSFLAMGLMLSLMMIYLKEWNAKFNMF